MIAGVFVKRQPKRKDPFEVLDREMAEVRAIVKDKLERRLQDGATIVGVTSRLGASGKEVETEVVSHSSLSALHDA